MAEIKLARLELSADLRVALKRAAFIALCIPPLVVGYAFAMAALASWLAETWGRTAALGSIAAVQIVVGGIAIFRALAALARTRILARASADLTRNVQGTIAALSDRTESSNA